MRYLAIECLALTSLNRFFKGDDMKRTVIVLSLTLLFGSVQLCLAQSPQMGTWKLNEAVSKIPAGTTKNHTVIYEAAGANIKIIVEGTDPAGKAVRHEWTGKFDGKYYPVTGDPTSDTRSYKQINSRTLTFTAKQGTKVTLTGRVVVSADGKTRTVTTTATDPAGKKTNSTVVYDKQ
jgi:hypothetical protein